MLKTVGKTALCATILSMWFGAVAHAEMTHLGKFCLEAVTSHSSSGVVKRYMELNIIEYDPGSWSISGWVDALRDASDRFLVTGTARLQGGLLEAGLVGGAADVRVTPFQAQVSLLSPSTFIGIYSDSEADDPYGADVWSTRLATCR